MHEGDFFAREFLGTRLKKKLYEVVIVNPSLIPYIIELTNSLDFKGILYIDLELLAYAVKTTYQWRPSDLLLGLDTFVIRIIDH